MRELIRALHIYIYIHTLYIYIYIYIHPSRDYVRHLISPPLLANSKEQLKEVAGALDPAALEAARVLCMGPRASSRPAQVPMVIFYGPPGTGKTYAMQIIAREAELEPYILRIRSTEVWEREFEKALDEIGRLNGAVVLLDECETVFSSRDALSSYGSVLAETKKAWIGIFLQWVNGLESRPSRQLLLIMATNKLEALDDGIKSRSRIIKFNLPDAEQRRLWWSQHAVLLQPEDHVKLATDCLGLSFRDMWEIAEQMSQLLARKFKKLGRRSGATLSLAEYREQVATFKRALRPEYNVGDYLQPVEFSDAELKELTWDEYLADDELKVQLKAVASITDRSREKEMRMRVHGNNAIPSGPPIMLLYGPPGTGKTYGMKVVAAQTKKNLYILSLKGLVGNGQIREVFSAILQELASMRDAIVFLDECEEFFESRASFGSYNSVDIVHKKHIVTTFIQWADGLAKGDFTDHGLLLCLATNMKDALDPAVADRARKQIEFKLPNHAQRLRWWTRHARHLGSSASQPKSSALPLLSGDPWELALKSQASEHEHLARLSEGLSFRNLWAVSEQALEAALSRSAQEPSFEDYKRCVVSLRPQALLEMAKKALVYTRHGLLAPDPALNP